MAKKEPYVVNLGPEVGQIQWNSIGDAIVWVAELRGEWSWLGQSATRQVAQGQLWARVANPIDSIQRAFEQAKSFEAQEHDGGTVASQFDSGCTELETLFEKQPWLRPSSSHRAAVQSVRERQGDTVAGTLVALWLRLDVSRDSNPYIVTQACVEAALFERGAPPRIEWESEAYAEIIKTLTNDRTSHLAAIKEGQEQLAKQAASFMNFETGRTSLFAESQASRDAEWRTSLNAVLGDLRNIKEAYDKHMTLAAPVEYWVGKQKRHFKWMVATGAMTAIGMVLAGWMLHCELTAVANKAIASGAAAASTGIKQEGAVALLSAVASWRLGSFILLATLAFWVLRLLVRVFLSNLHLENDAAERVTMVKTYLALIRDGKLTGDGENLKAMLAALFRPTGDGLVRDEGIPPTTLDWFTKLSSK